MRISKKLIMNEAYEVKNFFDKNKKLPKYATISNSQFTPPQYSYVFAKLVSNISLPTVNKMSVASPNEDKGDVVDFTLKQKEYISIAQRVVDFIERNKRCPNYVEYKKKNISWSLYTYCFIKILSFYNEKGRLPSTCIFNSKELQNTKSTTSTPNKTVTSSTSSSKKTTVKSNCKNPYTNYPKDTVQGAGHMGQKTSYYCLPHSFRSCMYKFGLKLDETKIAQVMGTTKKGTGHEGVTYAIKWVKKNYGKEFTCEWKYLSDMGKTTSEQMLALAKLICRNDTDIIVHSQYQYKYGHYETIYKVDVSKKIVYVLNSLGYRDGIGYKGYVEQRSFDKFKGYINAKKGVQSICIIRKK